MNQDFRPEEFVTEELLVRYQWIKERINEIRRYSCRNLVLQMLEDPDLTILDNIDAETAWVLYDHGLIKEQEGFIGYLSEIRKRSPNKFIYSPGSRLGDHHAYPGGLVYHTAANIEIGLGIADVYQRIYGLEIDRDLLVIALAFHDIAKASLLAWDQRGTYPEEYKIAGTEAHHLLSLSEAILRGFPFPVIRGIAFCHAGFETPKEDVEKYLQAAYLLAGNNLPQENSLEPQVEDMICLFADSDVFIGKWAIRRSMEILENKGLTRQEIYRFLSSRTEYSVFRRDNFGKG